MKIEENDVLMRIYLSEKEKFQGKLLYEYIIYKAKELNIAGCSVFKGIMGFGADKRLHYNKFLDISENLPILIEIIDCEENINKLLPFLDEAIKKGFITMEKIHVIKYRTKQS